MIRTLLDGDPVKACDSILKEWGTTYADAQKNLPNMTQVQGAKQQPLKYEKGLLRHDGQPGFDTPSGKIELSSNITKMHNLGTIPIYVEPYQPTAEYPIKLINGTRAPYITHSKTRSDSPYLLEIEPMSTVDINPKMLGPRHQRRRQGIDQEPVWSGKSSCSSLHHRSSGNRWHAVRLARRPEHPGFDPARMGQTFGLCTLL